jgi:hypothetical protein
MVMEEPRHPVSITDYPGTYLDFDKWFSAIFNRRSFKALGSPFQRLTGQAINCLLVPQEMTLNGQYNMW